MLSRILAEEFINPINRRMRQEPRTEKERGELADLLNVKDPQQVRNLEPVAPELKDLARPLHIDSQLSMLKTNSYTIMSFVGQLQKLWRDQSDYMFYNHSTKQMELDEDRYKTDIENNYLRFNQALRAFFANLDGLLNPLLKTLHQFKNKSQMNTPQLRAFFIENYNDITSVPKKLIGILQDVDNLIKSFNMIKGVTLENRSGLTQDFDKFIAPLESFRKKIMLLGQGYTAVQADISRFRDAIPRGGKGQFDDELKQTRVRVKDDKPKGTNKVNRLLDEYGANPETYIDRAKNRIEQQHGTTMAPRLPKKRGPYS